MKGGGQQVSKRSSRALFGVTVDNLIETTGTGTQVSAFCSLGHKRVS